VAPHAKPWHWRGRDIEKGSDSMRLRLSASLLALLPVVLTAQPAAAQVARGSVYLSLMGEPFIAPAGQAPLGLRPAWLWLGAAAISELLGGALILLGLVTRVGALMIAAVMLVAMFGVHWSGGFFLQNRGIEFTVALLGMALALLISGGGRASFDEALFNRRQSFRRR